MPTTISYNRGAVVLLPFPFSDQLSAKVRPAIVTNPDYPSDDVLVVAVSSISGVLRPGEFAIQFWHEAGMIHPSFVKRAVCSIHAKLIRKQIGQILPTDLSKLDTAIRLRFGL